jgi:OOP family OmpA-OmpF porin
MDFGAPKAAPKPIESTPVAGDDDPDKDGIAGDADKCPNEAEDKDSFEDDNGCPDPDNDADGIADATDKCASEPEDKDNFQDDDGCPDPDNDADGVADAADKCADQPETRNGFEDEDGCPDEVPAKLAAYTGTIAGINFKVNSSDLLPASFKTLDKAVAVLTEFKDVKLEIQGHTDDQQLKAGGKFADNDALSQARADAVKQYFVKKGIGEDRLVAKGFGATVPIQDPTGLKGAKLNAARTVNRRVEFKLISPGGEAPAVKAEEPKPEEKKEEPKTDAPKADAPKADAPKEEKK